MSNRKNQLISIAVYGLITLIAVIAVSWISGNYEGNEKKQYIGGLMVGIFIFGKIINWLALRIFHIDISR